MKNSIIVFVCAVMMSGAALAGEGNSILKVTVKNLKSQDGKVSVTLFDNEGNFLKKGVRKTTTISQEGTAEVIFENLSQGEYACSVMHDENDNNELDTAVFGIPTEPYGFSNDARGSFGPASFEDSKFLISGDKQISINVN